MAMKQRTAGPLRLLENQMGPCQRTASRLGIEARDPAQTLVFAPGIGTDACHQTDATPRGLAHRPPASFGRKSRDSVSGSSSAWRRIQSSATCEASSFTQSRVPQSW